MDPLWTTVHTERSALAADLAGLDDERWRTPSLCEGLSVREVLAHMTAGASLNFWRWMAGVIRCRFDFDRQVAMRLAEHLGDSPKETLARFERVVTSTTAPMGSVVTWLAETVVHAQDIRRPLGIEREIPVEVLTRVAEYHSGTDLVVVAKGRIGGLRLAATDGPFETGSGPEVKGPTLALIMAMTGRAAYCDDLAGEGVAALRDRC